MPANSNTRPVCRQPLSQPDFLRDMALTLVASVLTGLAGGLLFILLVFACSPTEAAQTPPGSGRLTLYSLDGRPLRQAPLLKTEVGIEPRTTRYKENWRGEDYALLLLMPPDQELQAQKLSREIVFVVDNSGSMHGASITPAKA